MAPVRAKRPGTAREWAARFGVTPRTIRNTVAIERTDYEATAAKRRATAAKMRTNGASWADIAEAIGGSEWAARALVRRAKQATD